ncbi:MAG: hypothetical protein LN414_02785, partial [Candidatus Thermoplasmatota archaeon]|nr:hypothetical protein [Candidatus Thermoplasmatota archaeon]
MVDRGLSKTILVICLLIASTVPMPLMLADAPAEPVYNSATDLVARRTSTAPTIDGVVDPVWGDALKLGSFVSGNSGNFPISLRAMFDDDYIYILSEWTELPEGIPPTPPVPNVERDAW